MFGMFTRHSSSGGSGSRRGYQQPNFPAHYAPDFVVRPGDSYIVASSAAQARQAETDFVMRRDHTSYNASQPFQPDFAVRPGQTYNAGRPHRSSSTRTYPANVHAHAQADFDFAPRPQGSYNAGQVSSGYGSHNPRAYAPPAPVSFVPINEPAPGLRRSNATRHRSGHSHGSSHGSSSSSSRSHGHSHGHSHGSSRSSSSHSSHSFDGRYQLRDPQHVSRNSRYHDCVEYQ